MNDKVMIFSVLLVLVALAMVVAIWRFGNADNFATRRLYFAAGTITGLGIIFTLSMAMYYWTTPVPEAGGIFPGKEIFEACVQIIPPIITLVLGYYFGASTPSPTVAPDELSISQINDGTDSKNMISNTQKQKSE